MASRSSACGNGSIPACAGEPKASEHERHLSRQRVYPRVCGGTIYSSTPTSSRAGLSPRVRGNRSGPTDPQTNSGSIPACAGEPSPTEDREQSCQGLSPRVRGNHRSRGHTHLATVRGLSPRVRGNLSAPLPFRHPRHGSIPACAGEPISVAIQASIPACANLLIAKCSELSVGSIPACAGEPLENAGVRFDLPKRVYPRVCGGTIRSRFSGGSHPGLSPRVRGNPTQDTFFR